MKVLNIKVKQDYNKSLKSIFFEILLIEKYAMKILKGIEFGLKHDLVKVHVFKIEYKGKQYDFKFHRNNWDFLLNILMKFYIKIEGYENCANIKKLLESN